ncbi:MAG TPA: hypothetical protein O0W88_02350 [Methanocorpusculum sp.]|nr:hypothetical protein [Methanocorpusculum sp.]
MDEILVSNGILRCTDGKIVTPERCRFCMHSRYFVINGISHRSSALAFCQRERVCKEIDVSRATIVGCAEKHGDGYANIGNILS